MKRAALAMGMGAALAAFAVVDERDAAACGGCFRPPTETDSDVTDERMLLSVSPVQTTLYDQIKYVGNPQSFAWVLPIHGTVNVGLSADVLFDSVDTLTQTQIQAPPLNCPVPLACQIQTGPGGFSAGAADASAAGPPGVTVIKAQNVGPYATVQLSTNGDPTALNTWLAQNGFDIPADVVPTLDAYVTEGFDFLALKLLPDQGVQSMRPVRVTTTGASLSLPLRMAAIGTGATVGITIWVVGDGRYEPQNFPFFHIEDSQLVWDWSTSSSNYTTLRQQNEQMLNGKGWEIESSINLGEELVSSVILGGGTYYSYPGGGYPGAPFADGGADAGADYLPTTNPDGSVAETADQVREDDLKTLFAGMTGPSVRFTRIRSDISHAAMTTDFVLQASQDQSELTNLRQVTQSINEQCPIYGNDCSIIGSGTPAQAAASGPPPGGTGTLFGNGPASGGGTMFGAGTPVAAGSGSGNGGGGSTVGGCSTTATDSRGSPVGLVAVAGMFGVAMLRVRRTRRKER